MFPIDGCIQSSSNVIAINFLINIFSLENRMANIFTKHKIVHNENNSKLTKNITHTNRFRYACGAFTKVKKISNKIKTEEEQRNNIYNRKKMGKKKIGVGLR